MTNLLCPIEPIRSAAHASKSHCCKKNKQIHGEDMQEPEQDPAIEQLSRNIHERMSINESDNADCKARNNAKVEDCGPLSGSAAMVDITPYTAFRSREERNRVCQDYFVSQPYITGHMRSLLVDWLIEVHYRFKLHTETLFLTVNYIDRYLEQVVIPRHRLQLVGATALFIASKYEEVDPLDLKDLYQACDKSYKIDDIMQCERDMLETLKFNLTIASCHTFITYLADEMALNKLVVQLAAYFSQHALLNFSLCTKFAPSILAACCVALAKSCADDKPLDNAWIECLETASSYSFANLESCLTELRANLLRAAKSRSTNLRAAHAKFSTKRYGRVSSRSLPAHWHAQSAAHAAALR